MAVCSACRRDMRTAPSCTEAVVVLPDAGGTVQQHYPVERYRRNDPLIPQFEMPERCHDCGVGEGGSHHPGCDMERCPRCHGQLITCGCLDLVTHCAPPPRRRRSA